MFVCQLAFNYPVVSLTNKLRFSVKKKKQKTKQRRRHMINIFWLFQTILVPSDEVDGRVDGH